MKRLLLAVVAAGFLSGCATYTVGTHQPSLDSIQRLRQLPMEKMAVGDFGLAATASKSIDREVTVRGSKITSPVGSSFAAYLKDALVAELKAVDRYDAASPTVISAHLLENQLNAAGVSRANAALAAQFSVTRSQAKLYDEQLRVTHEWESSFVGAVAIPQAINEYTEMYSKLLMQLFADAEFQAAIAPKSD